MNAIRPFVAASAGPAPVIAATSAVAAIDPHLIGATVARDGS